MRFSNMKINYTDEILDVVVYMKKHFTIDLSLLITILDMILLKVCASCSSQIINKVRTWREILCLQ